MQQINIKSTQKQELIDITQEVEDIVKKSNTKNGICIAQTLHTTAAITINENADPDVKHDIIKGLEIFDNNNYQHAEGNSQAHIKSSLVGVSETMIIKDSQLQLGTWQGIMFCEFDGPRSRKVLVHIIEKT